MEIIKEEGLISPPLLFSQGCFQLPMSWYLQRCGYQPKSKSLEIGKEKHVELGKVMYYTQKTVRKSKVLAYAGYLLLLIALIFLLSEVIL